MGIAVNIIRMLELCRKRNTNKEGDQFLNIHEMLDVFFLLDNLKPTLFSRHVKEKIVGPIKILQDQ